MQLKMDRPVEEVLESLLKNLDNDQCLTDQQELRLMSFDDPEFDAKIDQFVEKIAEQMPEIADDMKKEFSEELGKGLKAVAKGEARPQWTKTVGQVSQKLYGVNANKQDLHSVKEKLFEEVRKQKPEKVNDKEAQVKINLDNFSKEQKELAIKIAKGVAGNPLGSDIRWTPPNENLIVFTQDFAGDLDANASQQITENINDGITKTITGLSSPQTTPSNELEGRKQGLAEGKNFSPDTPEKSQFAGTKDQIQDQKENFDPMKTAAIDSDFERTREANKEADKRSGPGM